MSPCCSKDDAKTDIVPAASCGMETMKLNAGSDEQCSSGCCGSTRNDEVGYCREAGDPISKPAADPTPKPESSGCCGDEKECCCDDKCLDQLALAICADNDGHIHPPDFAEQSGHADTASVDPRNSSECGSCGDMGKSESNTPLSTVNETSNPSGLRRRKNTAASSAMPKSACSEHVSLVREKQKDTLAAFGCICKAMLARGLQSCCSPRAPLARSLSASLLSLRGGLKPKSKISVSSCCDAKQSRVSLDSCCGDSTCAKNKTRTSLKSCCADGSSQRRRSQTSVDSCCAGGECTAANAEDVRAIESNSRVSMDSCFAGGRCTATMNTNACATARRSQVSLDSLCADSCCARSERASSPDVDMEKRSAILPKSSGGPNRCILAVKGMTCTGCENKLSRVLLAQPAISNVKTSLVLCRAEFDYDCDPKDLAALIQTIEQQTGFTTEQVAVTSSSARALDLITPMVDKLLGLTVPPGVAGVARLGKDSVRATYDPSIIGARAVLAAYDVCEAVLAPEPNDPALSAGAKHVRILFIRTIVSALLTIPVLILTWAPLPPHPKAYGVVSLVLATLAQTAIAGPFYGNAFKSLFFSHLVEMDMLVVLSTTTAYVYSVVAFAYQMLGRPLQGGSFFETSTLLVTLITLGQLSSALARQRAIASISLRSLQQSTATLVVTRPDGRVEEETIDVRLLQYGDTFRVLPDSVVITDGKVLSGVSAVDELMMTGEAVPVEKTVGSEVLAGTRNGAGNLLVKVTRLPGENTISDIADMVDDARVSRAHIQDIADRVCAWFVPTVLALALVTFMVWVLVGVYVRKESTGPAAVRALTYAIAVLAISCPCAIGLAVPMVILVASGVAAQLGVVSKSATTIETARQITHAVFDKTGTLTMGQLEVVRQELLQDVDSGTSVDTIAAILALVNASKHPVARAVATHLRLVGKASSPEVLNVEEVAGKGVQGTLAGQLLRGGNAKWLELESHPTIKPLLDEGFTIFCATYMTTPVAVFALADTIRPEAPSLLTSLASRNVQVSILSGDHLAAVQRVASALSIPLEHTRAGCLPADKAAYIRALQHDRAKVLFCGDGTNDSVALAQADIGVHMSSEASVSGAGAAASAASDAVLVRPSLNGIIALLGLSDAVHRRIMLNFAWAAVYNTVAMLFASGAFVNARIAPAYAGLGEIVSVLPVVLVATQLKWYSPV